MQQTPTYSGTGRHRVKGLQELIWRAEARAPATRRIARQRAAKDEVSGC
jgi:hypothetical protein